MALTDSNVLKLAPDPGTPAFRSAPHNIEAEQSLLGAILVNNDAFYRVSDFLEPTHFLEPIHQTIFETAGSLIRMGKVATPVTLKTFVPAETDLGGMTVGQYLARLAAEATTIINAQDYGRTIYELALRRDLIRIGEDMVNTTLRWILRRARRSRTPSAGCTNWPNPAATTAASRGSRRR
jgi:replicative DNA helicase